MLNLENLLIPDIGINLIKKVRIHIKILNTKHSFFNVLFNEWNRNGYA